MSGVTTSTVFVVSGGARGITAQCVIELSRHYRCKFILLGRSAQKSSDPAWAQGITDEAALKKASMADFQARGEKPTPAAVNKAVQGVLAQREIAETINAIKATGGDALYLSVDITNADALRAGLASVSSFGTINGIIHGAGNLADKLIENKTAADFEHVYSAKVEGLENLLAAIPAEQLQYLVLFSSVAGFYGNVGQADYAIANEVLNKTAHRFKALHPNCKVVSVNWGPWDGGMVTPQLRQYFESLNIKIIPVDVGTKMLVAELEAPISTSATQVVVGSPISAPAILNGSDLQTYTIHRTLSLADNPFLGDHVVDGKAVLPMVSAMAWMANAAEQIHRGYRYFSFLNYKVLKGIVFDETLASEYVLELKETSKTDERIVLDAMIRSDANGKPRFHYSAQLILLKIIPPAPIHQPLVDPEAKAVDEPGISLYENFTLFHRNSFRGVERLMTIGPKGLTMRCSLDEVPHTYQGQFPAQSFNYFMADVGLQAIGIWARRFYDAGSLPLRAAKGEHFMNVHFGDTFYVSMEVLSHSDTNVGAEIVLYDETGHIYMVVTDIEVTMSKRLNDLFLRNRLPESTR